MSADIELDGKLDERVWADAPALDDFLQVLPVIGGLPTEKTILKVLYDDDYLYVGIQAYDSFPERIIATGLERDVYYSSDDGVYLTLDTYYDRRQGILFGTNPLGARFDEEVLDNGNSFNAAFNTFWNVKTSRDSMGYCLEFRIPFSSLRFQASSEVVMGIKVVRHIKHKNETVIYPSSDPNLSNAIWRVNNTRQVVFRNLKARRPFYLMPYFRLNYQEQKEVDVDGQTVKRSAFQQGQNMIPHKGLDKVLSNAGFDVKYGISKNFTLDATFNTDFAQAEVDNRVLNFTRFGINLPEKRIFFLESRDYLDFAMGQSTLLFNSRTIGLENGNIVPIVGGVRVSGKSRGVQLGFLDLQTRGITAQHIDPQHFTVMRVRKEVWGNGSFIGAIATNRISTSGEVFNNQTIGIDAVRRFSDNKWIAAASLATTSDKQRPGFMRQSSMIGLQLARVATTGYNHSTYIDYAEKNFKPRMGFAPDSSFAQVNTTNQYIWKLKNDSRRNLVWLTSQVIYKYRILNRTNEVIQSEFEWGTSFKNGATILVRPSVSREFIPYAWHFIGDVIIPSRYYINRGLSISFGSKQTRALSYTVSGKVSEWYGGARWNFSSNGYHAFSKNLRLTYTYEFNAFRFPGDFKRSETSAYYTNLVSTGLSFTSSIYFSVKALLQYDDVSKILGGNFRLRINPEEGTDLFIVYNPGLNTSFGATPDTRGHAIVDRQTFIIKFTKAFGL